MRCDPHAVEGRTPMTEDGAARVQAFERAEQPVMPKPSACTPPPPSRIRRSGATSS